MRVLLRADAGIQQGTGHVMRCMTLAQELLSRGHRVTLMSAPIEVDWLAGVVSASGVQAVEVAPDALPSALIAEARADWVVVDSYRIPSEAVSRLAADSPVLAIVDGDDRGIYATLYLDQNLGAETIPRREFVSARMLAGSQFALVRREILAVRREHPWQFRSAAAELVAFLGGTDPTGSIVDLARAIKAVPQAMNTTVVAPERFHDELRGILDVRILAPTPELPRLLGSADLVVSAAGTSAWDVCALGVPALFVAVVDNQARSLAEAVSHGVALGLDVVESGSAGFDRATALISELVANPALRERLSRSATSAFDGGGAGRVVDRMEAEVDPLF